MFKKFKEWLLEVKEVSEVAFAEKEAEEMAALYNDYNEYAKGEMEKAIEAKVSKEDIDALKAELVANQNEQLKALNAALKEQGIALKRVVEDSQTHTAETLSEAIGKGLKANEDKLKAMGSNANSEHEAKANSFTIKAAGTMSISSNVTGEVPQALLLPGLNTIASRQPRLLDLVTRGSIGTNLVRWAYQANKDGSAGQTGEGSAKNQIDFDILTSTEDVVKTTAYIKVTDEMLEDIAWMQTEINNELLRELLKAIEAGCYSGDGTGNNLHGIKDVATAFAAGSFANSIDNANAVDVLTVAMNQIMTAEQGQANAILMHPSDVTALKMVKVSSTDKRYVERLAMVAGSLSLDGVPIIPTTLVTQDDYLVGDFTRAFVLERSAVNVEVGFDLDDFTKNLRTIRAEWRGVCYVKNNDRTAFVTGDFTTDAAALETP